MAADDTSDPSGTPARAPTSRPRSPRPRDPRGAAPAMSRAARPGWKPLWGSAVEGVRQRLRRPTVATTRRHKPVAAIVSLLETRRRRAVEVSE
ncbi:hypothetical protein GCM10009736_33710 [Actinomadura bangladeshensis]